MRTFSCATCGALTHPHDEAMHRRWHLDLARTIKEGSVAHLVADVVAYRDRIDSLSALEIESHNRAERLAAELVLLQREVERARGEHLATMCRDDMRELLDRRENLRDTDLKESP